MTKTITLTVNVADHSDIAYELENLSSTQGAAIAFLKQIKANGLHIESNSEIMRTFTADNTNSLAFQIVEAYCLLKSRMNRNVSATIANAVVDAIVA